METYPKKDIGFQLEVFQFIIKNASDYEYAFNALVGAY